MSLATHGADQMMVQRYLSARSQQHAAVALVLSGFFVLAQFALFLMIGIGLAAFFEVHRPAIPISRPDAAFSQFIVEQLPPGLRGLTLAAVFAACMSTVSSSLNSSAAVLVNDFELGVRPGEVDATRLAWCRGATILFGVLQVVLALGAAALSENVVGEALAIAGFGGGLLLGLFGLARISRIRSADVAAGLVTGAAVIAVVHFTQAASWPWYSLLGSATTVLAGYGSSRLTGAAFRRLRR